MFTSDLLQDAIARINRFNNIIIKRQICICHQQRLIYETYALHLFKLIYNLYITVLEKIFKNKKEHHIRCPKRNICCR